MDSTFFVELKRRVGFDARDTANLRALWPVVAPHLQAIVDNFHLWLLRDPSAQAVFTGGEPQIQAQRRAFAGWMGDLFNGTYDFEYFQRRIDIGRTHVRVGLPQHYMFTSMEIVWREVQAVVAQIALPDGPVKLGSLHKLLALESAVMLESYKDFYSQRVREEERTVVEEKLTRSEHLAQLGQLAASLAHEIKNPLAGISGAIQVLRDQMDPGDPRLMVIGEILAQINRLDATVKDLLVYARPRPPEFLPCDLATAVHRVLKQVSDAAAFRHVPVNVQADDHVPPVPVDVRQIEQLIMNLLFNAAHACKNDGQIRVRISAADRKVVLAIADSGAGMSPQVRDRAFEPFFTTKSKGTGLGLPICRRIVEAHGGEIELESELGEGTTATVRLPQVWS